MDKQSILDILEQVETGKLTSKDALTLLKMQPFEDLGFAKPDYHRQCVKG